jgi:hypothetical protein
LELLHYFSQRGRKETEKEALSFRVIIKMGENATFSLVQHLGGFVDHHNHSAEAVVMGHTTILMESQAILNHTFSQDLPGKS